MKRDVMTRQITMILDLFDPKPQNVIASHYWSGIGAKNRLPRFRIPP
jgi:hypothetical protein